jgi:hypothetical protein
MVDRRTKPAEGYLMRSTIDNSVVEMDVSTAMQGMTYRAQGSSNPLYKPVSAVPGFLFKSDGGVVPTTFEPEQAVEVAKNQGKKDYPYRLAFGKDDPAFKAARVYKEDQIMRRVGMNQPWGKVLVERTADIATFGAYGALKDDNEKEAQERAYQNLYHPFAATAGTFGGIAVGLLFPYGKMAGVMGKGAMAAGKASGIARAAGTGFAATNLVQLSAKASQAARHAVRGGTFAKNLAGGLAATAVSEAPLSLAVAAADIVDYNKEFSMQALVADAGALYLLGVGIGAPIAFVGAGARSALGAARRGGAKGLGSTVAMETADFVENVARRGSYQHGVVGGVARWLPAKKFLHWFKHKMGSRGARTLTGEYVEDFFQGERTIRNAGEALDISNKTGTLVKQADDLRLGIKAFRDAAKTPEVAGWLDDAARNSDGIVNAKETLFVLKKNLPLYQTELSMARFTVPEGVEFIENAPQHATASLRTTAERLLSEASVPGPFADAQVQTAKGVVKILEQVAPANDAQALTKLVEAREFISASKLSGKGQYLEQIDNAIVDMTRGSKPVMDSVHNLEHFRKNLGELVELMEDIGDFRDFTGGIGAGERIKTLLEPMPELGKRIGISEPTYLKLIDDAGVTQQKTTLYNLDQFAKLNMARKAILKNEGAGFDAFLKRPVGPDGPLSFGDELLDSQIQTVMGFKLSTRNALNYLTKAGSPRGAAFFGGVLAYRAMSEEEKRENFESIRQMVIEAAASPERLIEAVGKTAGVPTSTDLVAGIAYATTLTTAASYLQMQMPKSGDPILGPEDSSMEEVDSFLEMCGALESPASVLATAQDGSVSLEAVDAVRTVYPELYTDMMLDLIEFMQTPSWALLTDNQRLGLDNFAGGALGIADSWGVLPGPLFAQTPMQQQALGKNIQQSNPDMARMQSQRTATGSQKVSGL